ncbi:hypothetical protein [Haloarcula salinisoli]|uniref:Uncharacterized protein n=1 Tax=Haloarcula salinisoli TaxID=2487746 RepID=A0A8J8C7N7_9EURY|nr:hypothetical protein [Halomicroarcula salinisoli]MBX0303477.1 hypothetical protein [Halomicroarcula salinisoli]
MRSLKKLWTDNRGIEGLPIRLVIALVVGVASLAIMTSILGGLPQFDNTEVTVQVEDDQMTVEDLTSGSETLTFEVVTDEGEEVNGAQVVITEGTASLYDDQSAHTEGTGDDDNTVDVDFQDEESGDSADVVTDLREDQDTATLKVEVQPPTDSNYVDEQENPEILVTA